MTIKTKITDIGMQPFALSRSTVMVQKKATIAAAGIIPISFSSEQAGTFSKH
jgi:hypothetical protein